METIEKIKKQTDALIEADDALIDILEASGKDSETQYKNEYLTLLEDLKSLQKALHKLLWEDFDNVWREVDYAAEQCGVEPEPYVFTGTPPKINMIDVARAAGLGVGK